MKAHYEVTKVPLCLGGLLCLPVVWGCGHESAASPVANGAPTASSVKPIGQQSPNESLAQSSEPAAPNGASSTEITDAGGPTASAAPDSPPTASFGGQRPAADRRPTLPGEAEKITFEDLNLGMQADVVFRPFMLSDRVKELEGRRISIAGYMHPGQSAQRGIKKFILLKNTQCKFGPGGQADHLTDVELRQGETTKFTPRDVRIEGTLKIEPFLGPDGNTWSIYRLEDAQIH